MQPGCAPPTITLFDYAPSSFNFLVLLVILLVTGKILLVTIEAGKSFFFALLYKVEFCDRNGQNSQFFAPAAPIGAANEYIHIL